VSESLRDIRLFVAVYEERSFTAAATREHATQSGVSQHIRKLEARFGAQLFSRQGGRVAPTPAGDSYYRRCVELLRAYQAADGAVRAYAGGPLVSHPIKDIRRHIPNVDTRIVAMFRNEASVRVDGDTMIQPGDEVFFLAATRDVRLVLAELRRMDKPVRRVMIAGGANIGLRLARALDTGEGLDIAERFNVKIIESWMKGNWLPPNETFVPSNVFAATMP